MKIKLRLPFKGKFPITFPFGAQFSAEEIRDKYQAWGIIGHNGLDFALPEGTGVVAVYAGEVIQAGFNGDFGISVTLKHRWGKSLYAHLKEVLVSTGKRVEAGNLVGLSGTTGLAFGPHLHFGIKPNREDSNNGYGGFINPSFYFIVPTRKRKRDNGNKE